MCLRNSGFIVHHIWQCEAKNSMKLKQKSIESMLPDFEDDRKKLKYTHIQVSVTLSVVFL